MADSSLDDFFAKKDKSKKSKNKKFGASTQISKSTEDGKLSEKGSRRDKDKSSNSSYTPSNISSQNDEEWHEYNEQEKDYSGLKIQSLQISEKEKEDSEKECEQELDEDGEPIRSKDGQSGPWKIVSKSEPEPPQPPVPEVKEEIKTPNVVAGKYVPPHERLSSNSMMERVAMKKSRSPRVAPKLDCQSDFPSLSSAVETSNKLDNNGDNMNFEQVRSGSRARDDVNGRSSGPRLDLGNKYTALEADNL